MKFRAILTDVTCVQHLSRKYVFLGRIRYRSSDNIRE